MSDNSPRLDLPFILPSQAQKHVTHNEALRLLDALVQLAVEGFGAVTPPAQPAQGEVWAIGAGAGGAWGGKMVLWRSFPAMAGSSATRAPAGSPRWPVPPSCGSGMARIGSCRVWRALKTLQGLGSTPPRTRPTVLPWPRPPHC